MTYQRNQRDGEKGLYLEKSCEDNKDIVVHIHSSAILEYDEMMTIPQMKLHMSVGVKVMGVYFQQ